VAGRIKSMKNSNDSIGNQTRDVPACSAVPQPTAPPRAPLSACTLKIEPVVNLSLSRIIIIIIIIIIKGK
jgi:hypothetical protein